MKQPRRRKPDKHDVFFTVTKRLLRKQIEILECVLHQQRCIVQQQEQIMASVSTFSELLSAMNTATNTLAENFTALLARQDAGGMTAAEEQANEDALKAQIDALKALASSTTNPVPPIPPVPPV